MAVTLAGYLEFIRGNMQIPTSALPDTSPAVLMTLAIAEEVVNPTLRAIASPRYSTLGYTGPNVYELAVYNLGGDNLINFAPDVPGGVYFENLRAQFGCNSFVAGVISATADEATSESLTVPDALKGMTLADLQRLKTPWGRAYTQIAMQYGTLWGIS